jgi:1-aminocyclopropane-1-carboxylate deaminase/D-cysteine desulfhydrase-like pyridoxal-dependent ACC family enzyme
MVFFAHHYFSNSELSSVVDVVAVPCAGTEDSFLGELKSLNLSTMIDIATFPYILSIPSTSKRRFGEVTNIHLSIWKYLQSRCNIVFDLLYATRAFELMLLNSNSSANLQHLDSCSLVSLFPSHNILYYHCGGCEGNVSQLDRYRRAGLETD